MYQYGSRKEISPSRITRYASKINCRRCKGVQDIQCTLQYIAYMYSHAPVYTCIYNIQCSLAGHTCTCTYFIWECHCARRDTIYNGHIEHNIIIYHVSSLFHWHLFLVVRSKITDCKRKHMYMYYSTMSCTCIYVYMTLYNIIMLQCPDRTAFALHEPCKGECCPVWVLQHI